MIRLVELLLLVAPLAGFVAWRVWAPGKVPTSGMIIGMAIALAVMAGVMVWMRFQDGEPSDSTYIPSHIENGRIVPGRRVP